MSSPQRGHLYYLAGPMSGHEEWNFPAFHEMAAELREMGFRILNPAETAGGDPSMEKPRYMRIDFGYLLASDGILLMEGWWNSDGAKRELMVADALGLPAWEIRAARESMEYAPVEVQNFEIGYAVNGYRRHTKLDPK